MLLLDEVTVDLDVLVRKDLLQFLIRETEERTCTIIYATHIFDGLGFWPTHLAHVAAGSIKKLVDLSEPFPELDEILGARKSASVKDNLYADSPLLLIVEKWLREDHKAAVEKRKQEAVHGVLPTRWEVLSENMKELGDKYYNYWR